MPLSPQCARQTHTGCLLGDACTCVCHRLTGTSPTRIDTRKELRDLLRDITAMRQIAERRQNPDAQVVGRMKQWEEKLAKLGG